MELSDNNISFKDSYIYRSNEQQDNTIKIVDNNLEKHLKNKILSWVLKNENY